ncbi:type IV pilus biogenesis protein PilP [Salinicola endophyticus]|uniref:Type IV pilus biogenesis protein PilP n=1 Tax=Salinicola endophyticus TaxID=1949083 RepID=A0AB74U7B4_9GAMM
MPMPNRDRQGRQQTAVAVCVLALLMLFSGTSVAAESDVQPDPTLDKLSSLLRGNLLLEAQARQKALLAELDGSDPTAVPAPATATAPEAPMEAGEPATDSVVQHRKPTTLPQPVAIYGGGGAWVASLLLPDGRQVDVRAGQRLDAYRVRGIDATTVVLQDAEGKPHTLTLVGGPS